MVAHTGARVSPRVTRSCASDWILTVKKPSSIPSQLIGCKRYSHDSPSYSEDHSMDSCWVVIPAYNEAATIRDVASRAIRQVTKVIVVDDGSTDGTVEVLSGLPVTILRNPT